MKKEILYDRIIVYQKAFDIKTHVFNVTSISEIRGVLTVTGDDISENRATFRLSDGEIVYKKNRHKNTEYNKHGHGAGQ